MRQIKYTNNPYPINYFKLTTRLTINGENLTNRKQTRWNNIYTGSVTHPVFSEIYAPLDGRIN